MEEYEVLSASGESRGRIRIEEQGLYKLFTYCWEGAAAPSRLMLRGDKGEICIGVPIPEGGTMRLRRRMSCRSVDVGNETGFFLIDPNEKPEIPEAPKEPEKAEESKPPEPEEKPARRERHWREEAHPEKLVRDEELKESLRGASGALVSQVDGDTFLALRYTPGGVFPMMPAFRYGVSAKLGGRSYIVFRLRDGKPA